MIGWEVLSHLPDSPDLAPTDFNVLWSLEQTGFGICLTKKNIDLNADLASLNRISPVANAASLLFLCHQY